MSQQEALRAAETRWVATPPQNCLNGCSRGAGDAREQVLCEPGTQMCRSCTDRLDTWLRQIPDNYALLPHVVDHGSVPADPGTKHTKRPDPPAPMRLDVVDLLDVRPGFGVLGVVHSWAELVREERRQPQRCVCGHMALGHPQQGHCTATRCTCAGYRPAVHSVSGECGVLVANLPWAVQQDWIGDLYAEVKQLHRTLADTVGEYRRKPVGKCAAFVNVAIGQINDPATTQVLCGGALVMETEGTAVRCLSCGTRHEANQGLRELGLIVGRLVRDDVSELEAS